MRFSPRVCFSGVVCDSVLRLCFLGVFLALVFCKTSRSVYESIHTVRASQCYILVSGQSDGECVHLVLNSGGSIRRC